MNITLKKYSDEYKRETIVRIAKFFGLHMSFLNHDEERKEIEYDTAENDLQYWLTDEDSELYLIFEQEECVGFLRIGYRGKEVAWIEDIFVDEERRGRGIAAESIRQAEEIIASNPQYTAVCFDVVPRNKSALALYYKLGYDKLSIVTVRKELNHENDDFSHENFLGYDFKL